ncbi:MAG: Panacea domain-containing protein [Sumerlaeia bacterium]
MNIVLLNKALFYFDLHCLMEDGQVFTEHRYVALEHGPVLGEYERKLVKKLAKHGIATQESDGRAKPIKLLHEAEETSLSVEQRDLARRLGKKFAAMTSQEASDYSHLNLGWEMAWKEGLGGNPPQRGAAIIDMTIAMQQLLDEEEDDWLAAPFSDEEKKALQDLEESALSPW